MLGFCFLSTYLNAALLLKFIRNGEHVTIFLRIFIRDSTGIRGSHSNCVVSLVTGTSHYGTTG
jgi:hypothetical protein